MPNQATFMHELADRLDSIDIYERRRAYDRVYDSNIMMTGVALRIGLFPSVIPGNRNIWSANEYYQIRGRIYTAVTDYIIPDRVQPRLSEDSIELGIAPHFPTEPNERRMGAIHPALCGAWQLTGTEDNWRDITYVCMGCGRTSITRGDNNYDNQE